MKIADIKKTEISMKLIAKSQYWWDGVQLRRKNCRDCTEMPLCHDMEPCSRFEAREVLP